MYNLHCTCMWTILSFNEEINDKLNQNYHTNVKKHRISGWGLPSMLLNYTECDVSISKLLGFETFPFFKWSRIRQKTWSQKIYWDPRMFWDDIKIMFSSRDWWDPGILQDGTSSCRDLVEFFGSKTNQSFWSHYLFNTLNPQKKLGFYFSISITGSRDIRGSRRGLVRTWKPVPWHASANLGLMLKRLQIKDQCGSEIELTRNVELNRDQLITWRITRFCRYIWTGQ